MKSCPVRRGDITLSPVPGGYSATTERGHRVWLNATAAMVLDLCTGRSDPAAITAIVADAFSLSSTVAQRAADEVTQCLADLTLAGLVTSRPAPSSTPHVLVCGWPELGGDRSVVAGQAMALLRDATSRGVNLTFTPGGAGFGRNTAAGALLRSGMKPAKPTVSQRSSLR